MSIEQQSDYSVDYSKEFSIIKHDLFDLKNETKTWWDNGLNKNEKSNLPDKIWDYTVSDEFLWFLSKDENWFVLKLSDFVSIIVKNVDWKIKIQDTQQEEFTDEIYAEISLNQYQTSINENVNKLNKLILSRGYTPLMWDDLIQAEKLINSIQN